MTPSTILVSLLSIDAWRDSGGWQWNNWSKVGAVPVGMADLKPRELLRQLRGMGYLCDYSKGRVRVEDDQYNVVISARGTGQPLLAIAYGEAQP